MLKKLILLLFISNSIFGQIIQYDFNNTLAPTVGTATLTPAGSVASGFTIDRFGVPNGALELNPGAADNCFFNMSVSDNMVARTVCFWFKAYSSTNSIQMIYEADGNQIDFGQTQFGIKNGNIDYLSGANHVVEPIALNKWYFAAISRSGSDVKFYLNCKLLSTATNLSNSHSASAPLADARIGLPATGPLGTSNNYRGALDEFRIYNSALNASQLMAIMGNQTLTASLNMPNHFCFNQPIVADGSASTGSPLDETSHFWEIVECDQYGVVAPGAPVWSQWYQGLAGQFTFPSAANGGPSFITCGKNYRVKLATSNCQVPWSETAKIIRIDCLPSFPIAASQTLCPGGIVSVGKKTTNPNLSFSWQPTTWLTNPSISYTNLSIPAGYTTACPGSTTYTLTTTDMITGCYNTSTTTVSFATNPTVPTITESKTPACVNGNLDCSYLANINASTCPSGVSYAWTGPNVNTTSPNITVFPSVPTTYTLNTTNACFSNAQTYTLNPCFKPSGSFPLLSVPPGVQVNWSGNYPSGGFRVFDNTLPSGAARAYNASRIKLRIYSRWGVLLFTQDLCATCEGIYNGSIFYNCVFNGNPLPIDSYAFQITMDNCTNQGYVVSGWFNVTGHARMSNPDGSEEDVVNIGDITFNKKPMEINAESNFESLDLMELNIFPNPSEGVFKLNVENYDEQCEVVVTDLLGNIVVDSFKFNNEAVIDLSNFNAGVYLVKAKAANKSITKKIIKN